MKVEYTKFSIPKRQEVDPKTDQVVEFHTSHAHTVRRHDPHTMRRALRARNAKVTKEENSE
jgi:hypothetical protein